MAERTVTANGKEYRKGWNDAIDTAVHKAEILSRSAEKPRHKMIAAQVASFILALKVRP